MAAIYPISGRRLRVRLAPIILGLGLASVGLEAMAAPPFGLPDRGVLRLQLGSTTLGGHQPRRWIHELDGLPGPEQSIGVVGKCGYGTDLDQLTVLTATGGLGQVGLGPDSIGVSDGPKGVACYRISSGIREALTFSLGADASLIPANAFYRLELDIEVKSNAEFVLEILQGTAVTATYRMRTGSSIRAGEGTANPEANDKIFNCTARSDSGPDSGAGDNCRWIVNELGQSFRLIPVAGEGSLEGGGDWGAAAYANNTAVYLTEGVIGALGCGPQSNVPLSEDTSTIGDGINDAQCSVTRIDPSSVGGTCTTPIGYVFRNIAGVSDEGCELIKSPGEQLAASISIRFPPETSTTLGAENATEIGFSDGAGNIVPFIPARCTGTVVTDTNGNRTIAEVLSVPGFAPDIVSGGAKDWACILDNTQEYRGGNQMKVTQTILFWGDIVFARP
jgi:hypothetical protein